MMTMEDLVQRLVETIEAIEPEDQADENDTWQYFEKVLDPESADPDRVFGLLLIEGPQRVSLGRRRGVFQFFSTYAWTGIETLVRQGQDAIQIQDTLVGASGNGIQRIDLKDTTFFDHVEDDALAIMSLTFSVEWESC